MIIGKFLDPRAPSLPQQVGENTDDIADILQENEEQSANIQKNTDDIELLKQQVSESGTRVRVDGQLVAEWSPDELTDDLQQLRLAQSSDSLAIVGLQSDNITNKQNIAKLDAETLKTPFSPPVNTELVGIGTNNAQVNISLGNGINIANGMISSHLQYKKIWENAAPLGTFPAQTITLDLTDYKFLIIVFASRGDWESKSYTFAFIVPIDNQTYTACYWDTDNLVLKRSIASTTGGVTFGAGDNQAEWSNKPLQIYGVR